MAKGLKIGALGGAITKELTIYHENVLEKVNQAGAKAVKDLVSKTKATAPEDTGSFKSNIASKKLPTRIGEVTHVWYVKGSDYRLTHLLAHGHATVNGGRVPGNPFLQNAVNDVLPEYERTVEEAIKNG